MSGRCDGCGEIGDVWCGECLSPHPSDAIATRTELRNALRSLTEARKAVDAAASLHSFGDDREMAYVVERKAFEALLEVLYDKPAE